MRFRSGAARHHQRPGGRRIVNALVAVALAAAARAENPFVTSLYTADPSARLFPDGRVWVYTSHDESPGTGFVMKDWRAFSSADLNVWTDHGVVLSLSSVPWATADAWAPDCVVRNGTYYFYFPVDRTKIGVATAAAPQGPFVDALGHPLVDRTMPGAPTYVIDPAAFVDDDGQGYLYFGNPTPCVVKLRPDMVTLASPILALQGAAGYFEAPFMIKRGGLYYFSYAESVWPGAQVRYATASDPLGPFTTAGVILDAVGINTTHHSMVKRGSSWYLFYHDGQLPGGSSYRRAVAADRMAFKLDGTIGKVTPTLMGVGQQIRLDAGAPSASFTDSAGKYWYRDQAYSAGTVYASSNPIAGTIDDALYQTMRTCDAGGVGCPFAYDLAVPSGSYTVTLHFAETVASSAGARRFDVRINQALVLSQLDVLSEVGRNTACTKTFTGVPVSGGALRLSFEPGASGDPMVSAIHVRREGITGSSTAD